MAGHPKLGGHNHGIGRGVKGVREDATGQRLPGSANLFVNAATVVGRQESAGAVGALANAIEPGLARNRLEGIAAIALGAAGITKPRCGVALAILLDLCLGNHYLKVMAAAAALRTGEPLLGIDAENTQEFKVTLNSNFKP